MTDVQGRIITVSNDSQAECYHSACFLTTRFKHESWMEVLQKTMKAVYYGLAAGEEERKNKREELKKEYQNDAEFYASYVDIAEQYNESLSQRPGYQSMLRAIRKNRIDTIYVSMLEDLNMSENMAMKHMLNWKEKGVSVIVGDKFSTGEMSREEIIDEISDIYLDRIFADYLADIITFSTVYISHPNWKTPFAYIKGKCKEDVNLDALVKSTFYDVTNKYKDGFFVYQPKFGGWDFVDPDAEVFLMNEFAFFYSIALEDLPFPEAVGQIKLTDGTKL